MDVGDDGGAHGRRTLAKALALVAAVVLWVVAAALLWRTEVPDLSLPDLAAEDYFPAALLDRIEDYRTSRLRSSSRSRPRSRCWRSPCGRHGRWRRGSSGSAAGACAPRSAVGLAVVAAGWLATLPFGAISLSRRRDFGLSEQSWVGWLTDR